MTPAPAAARGVRVLAPAKLNLYLHVTGRRADGYHELDSLVAFAGVGDVVEAHPAGDLTLAVAGPNAAALAGVAAADNLVLRAARNLRRRLGISGGAALRLEKTLPVAAGIGGGSADAAAALRALLALWGVPAQEGVLADLALELGADVPACLAGRPVRMSGIGERLTPAPPLPPAWVVLANPGVSLATPDVFRRRRGPFSAPVGDDVAAAPDAAALAAILKRTRNDLAEAATALVPAVAQVLDALKAAEGCLLARMSGSGATCFGLFAESAAADAAAEALARAHPDWWLAAAPLLAQAPPPQPL